MYSSYDSFNLENKSIFTEKSSDKQKQSLHYTYEILYHLLSVAEKYAGIKNGQYKTSNIFISTKYKDLKSEFAWELHCFQSAKKKYYLILINLYKIYHMKKIKYYIMQ